jgi:formylmethanofuran dehydrogenase subunit A
MKENPQVKRDIAESFNKGYYTVGLTNYPVREYLAPHPFVIDVDVEA